MIYHQRMSYLKLPQIYIKIKYGKYKVSNAKGTLIQSSVPLFFIDSSMYRLDNLDFSVNLTIIPIGFTCILMIK